MKNFKTTIARLPHYTNLRITGVGYIINPWYESGFDITCQVQDVTIFPDGTVSIENPVGVSAQTLHTYLPEIRSCEIVHERIEPEVWISPNEPIDDFGYPIKCRD